MASCPLDETDRELLDLLQENARYKATSLAEEIGVSDNTVHNRMARLEEAGVITGYTTAIDYQSTGLRLSFHFTCTTRISERSAVAEEALALPQVVEVTELMTGQENLHIKAVGAKDADITHVAEQPTTSRWRSTTRTSFGPNTRVPSSTCADWAGRRPLIGPEAPSVETSGAWTLF
ncbi:Lrp/AsnC family transcriptional regulator [Saliphagus sp. GCM10025308]